MTNDEELKPEGAPERSPKAGAGAPSGVDGNGPKHFSVQRKMAIVARLLRGEPLDLVARQMNVSVAGCQRRTKNQPIGGAKVGQSGGAFSDGGDVMSALARALTT